MKKVLALICVAGVAWGQALTTSSPSTTYGDLLHLSHGNAGVDGTFRLVYDGKGNASGLSISTAGITLANPLGVTSGGTGLTSPGASGNILTSDGTAWTSAAPVGGSMVYPGAGIANSTGSAWGTSLTAPSGVIVGTTDTQTLSNKSFGSGMTWPTFNQNTTGTAANVTGTVAVGNGGTGLSTLAAGYVPVGNGTSAFSAVQATSANTASTIVQRDASGNFSAGAVTVGSLPMNVAPGNGNYYGKVMLSQTAGAALAAGDVVYLASADSKWYDAKADAAATSGPVLIGICPAAITSGSTGVILIDGVMEKTGWGLTAGSAYYVSPATAGAITTTVPSTSGQQVRVVGHALSTVDLYFHPSVDWGQI